MIQTTHVRKKSKKRYTYRGKEDEKDGSCSMHGGDYSYKILVGKSDGNRSLGRPRGGWDYNIRMDLREIGR
jgi:hypothetical protein